MANLSLAHMLQLHDATTELRLQDIGSLSSVLSSQQNLTCNLFQMFAGCVLRWRGCQMCFV